MAAATPSGDAGTATKIVPEEGLISLIQDNTTEIVDEKSITEAGIEITPDQQIAYDALRAKLETSGFDLSISGYESETHYDPMHKPCQFIQDLIAAGISPKPKLKEPEVREYLIIEVSPGERLKSDKSCLGHEYFLKAKFHSGLHRFMSDDKAKGVDKGSKLPGHEDTEIYRYKMRVNPGKETYLKIVYHK